MLRYLAGGPAPARVAYRDGLVLCAPHGTSPIFIHREIFIDRCYCSLLTPLEPGDVVLDIGGNVGIFSVFACKSGASLVHTYEPMHENIACLEANLSANGCTQAHWEATAVGDVQGTQAMVVSSNFGGHVLGAQRSKIGGISETKVQVTTLDAIFKDKNLDTVDFLKLDCEGAEGLILPASLHLLPRIRKIAMEFHDQHSILDHTALERLLQESNFTTQLSWDGTSDVGYIYAARND